MALLDVEGVLAFDGEVATGSGEPERYVVAYLTTPAQERHRLSADPGMGAYTLTTMSVGQSPNECRWVAEKVHAALTRARPNASCSPITLRTAGQVRRDDSINPPAWIATDVWRFATPK